MENVGIEDARLEQETAETDHQHPAVHQHKRKGKVMVPARTCAASSAQAKPVATTFSGGDGRRAAADPGAGRSALERLCHPKPACLASPPIATGPSAGIGHLSSLRRKDAEPSPAEHRSVRSWERGQAVRLNQRLPWPEFPWLTRHSNAVE